MSRLGGWFRFGGGRDGSDEKEVAAERLAKQAEDMEDAMKWTELIMNDDIDGAWEALQKQDSVFHHLGSATIAFMRSVLGFEKSVMADTSARLAECETRANAELQKAQRAGALGTSSKLYPPGTEYELVRAESQLLSAVVGVLHENLVEAMRSFLKLRKAFITLDGIVAAEAKALAARAASRPPTAASAAPPSESFPEPDGGGQDERNSSESDLVEAVSDTPDYRTQPSTAVTSPERTSDDQRTKDSRPVSPELLQSQHVATNPDIFETPVDVFIHSGANMCFGIILLLLTIIPPAFSRILSAVGYRGDRSRGINLLWQASAFPNINGALAGMVLLVYYNAFLGAVDIQPAQRDYDEAAETLAPPRERCDRLLAVMRHRYPDSQLWRIEDARRLAVEGHAPKGIALLTSGTESKMKQVAAISNFELSIQALVVQDWNLMRKSFLRCMEINDWSPAIYYYMAGCASLELYRDAFHSGDATEARRQKTKAEEYLRKAPTVAGKKRFMARPLPIETFLLRKMSKWEARAKALGVDLADALASSPALEVCYVWNGQKRMGPDELARAVENLKWERCTASKEVVEEIKKEKDEMAIWAVGMGTVLKRSGRWEEARSILRENVIHYDNSTFKGDLKDDYVLPAATYEMAVISWMECCSAGAEGDEDVAVFRRRKLEECQELLNKTKEWEAYTLDARIGLRVQSGLETLKWFRKKMGWE